MVLQRSGNDKFDKKSSSISNEIWSQRKPIRRYTALKNKDFLLGTISNGLRYLDQKWRTSISK